MEQAKFLRRVNIDDYFGTNQVSITIGEGGGTDTYDVENIPLETVAGTAYEFEIEGKRIVFIGYETRN